MRTFTISASLLALLAACGGPPPAEPPPVAPVEPPPAEPVAMPEEPPAKSFEELRDENMAKSQAAWEKHDAKLGASVYTEDAISASPDFGGWKEETGRAPVEGMMGMLFKAFPDLKAKSERRLMIGKIVVDEWVTTGTHTGPFMGMEPSNKKTGYRGVSMMWLNDKGMITREHTYLDMMTIMAQMGKGLKGLPSTEPMELPSGEPEVVRATNTEQERKNLATVQAAFDAMGKHDFKVWGPLFADDGKFENASLGKVLTGSKDLKRIMDAEQKMTPDLETKVTKSYAAGDFVVAETVSTGTMTGAMGPMKPTKKTGTTNALYIMKLKDGKINWARYYNNRGQTLVGYGLMPDPSAAPADAASAPAAAKK